MVALYITIITLCCYFVALWYSLFKISKKFVMPITCWARNIFPHNAFTMTTYTHIDPLYFHFTTLCNNLSFIYFFFMVILRHSCILYEFDSVLLQFVIMLQFVILLFQFVSCPFNLNCTHYTHYYHITHITITLHHF